VTTLAGEKGISMPLATDTSAAPAYGAAEASPTDSLRSHGQPTTGQLAQAITIDCERALRRLDGLSREHYDVVLVHARELVRHAAKLSRAMEHGVTG
jgi:hypothetical protein